MSTLLSDIQRQVLGLDLNQSEGLLSTVARYDSQHY